MLSNPEKGRSQAKPVSAEDSMAISFPSGMGIFIYILWGTLRITTKKGVLGVEELRALVMVYFCGGP